MSPEEADNVSPSRGLSLILVFSQSSLLGEAILINPQKDKPTTNPPTHLPFIVFPLLFGERINTRPLSMAYKALHGPTDLSSNSFTCPSSPRAFFQSQSSCLPQGLCTCCFLYLLYSSALFAYATSTHPSDPSSVIPFLRKVLLDNTDQVKSSQYHLLVTW